MPTQLRFTKITTIPDGNCAFNAFALGLVDLLRAGMEFETDVQRAFLPKLIEINPSFTINDWDNFKNHLLNLNPSDLQILLAPVLRAVACEQAAAKEKSEYQSTLAEATDKNY